MVFSEKECPHKFLYSCVIVLLLYLLKFIHSHIEFFPTIMSPNSSKMSSCKAHRIASASASKDHRRIGDVIVTFIPSF